MQNPILEANFFRHPERLLYGLLLMVFTITGAYSKTRADDSEKIKSLFVMITAYYTEADIENIGAGLIFGASNNRLYIATADHVVRPKVRRKIVAADSIMVQFRSLPGEMFKAVLQPDSDEILDLAVLRIEDWEEKGIDIGGCHSTSWESPAN